MSPLSSEPSVPKQLGYKFVGDNIDKGVKARKGTHHDQSLLLCCSRHDRPLVNIPMYILTHVWIVLYAEQRLRCHRKKTILLFGTILLSLSQEFWVFMLKVGKALGTLPPVLDQFDDQSKVKKPSGAHKTPSANKDRDLIIEHLQKCNIFTKHKGRSHVSFPRPRDVLHSLNHDLLNTDNIYITLGRHHNTNIEVLEMCGYTHQSLQTEHPHYSHIQL